MRVLCARVVIYVCLALIGIHGFHQRLFAQEPLTDETAAPQESTLSDEEIISLVPIQVEGKKVRGPKIENIEDVKEKLSRRPGSNILTEEKGITETRAFNLQDVLQFAPGVRFQSRFGADEGQFLIRGTSLQNNYHNRGINILINSFFFGDADGFSDFESIDLLAYERIEIYKGANALRYGANSIGGAINFVPRTGYNAPLLQSRFEAGSYGTVIGQVSSGNVMQPFTVGGMSATMDYYVSASGNRQDGFQANRLESGSMRLPIPSYRAQAATARSQTLSGTSLPDTKRAEDTTVTDERTDGARTAP